MTEPSDNTATRPISVAELLAKNGSIGSPAPGGRRRRRRGNADAVTVAELTGEIPIIAIEEPPTAEDTPVVEEKAVEVPEPEEAPVDEAPVDEFPAEEALAEEAELEEDPAEPAVAESDPAVSDVAVSDVAESDYDEHLQQRDADPEPLVFAPRRHAHTLKKHIPHAPSGGAEGMTFDPLHDDDVHGDDDSGGSVATRPSYLRSPSDTLFGGDSMADDAARRGRTPGPEDIDLGDTQKVSIDVDEPLAALDLTEPDAPSPFMRGVWIVVQSVLAVALGAGLFVAFDQLWKWNNIVALALSVLVILGLVVGVRVVRKTEDIASTLIAVAVGAMVTLGPLALLQST